MTSKQKRARQGSSSSQPAKKPLLSVQKEVSSPLAETQALLDVRKQRLPRNPTPKLKGKGKDVLEPNISLTNRGEKSSSNSSNGMYFILF